MLHNDIIIVQQVTMQEEAVSDRRAPLPIASEYVHCFSLSCQRHLHVALKLRQGGELFLDWVCHLAAVRSGGC